VEPAECQSLQIADADDLRWKWRGATPWTHF